MAVLLSPSSWLATSVYFIVVPALIVAAVLPAYTLLLAVLTLLRHRRRHHCNSAFSSPWKSIQTALFQGTVYHIRHCPVVHAFKYPLYFSVVDLDEASDLFGSRNVASCHHADDDGGHVLEKSDRGILWPLSTLMMLKDEDHLKNGEGLVRYDIAPGDDDGETAQVPQNIISSNESTQILENKSMKDRVFQLVYERTRGKLDLRSDKNAKSFNDKKKGKSEGRKVLLVTHLQYYGYCFNPVSLYYILKPAKESEESNADNSKIKSNQSGGGGHADGDEEEMIEAIVVEVSNTPWNEMSIYVLHPESVDMLEHHIYSPSSSSNGSSAKGNAKAYDKSKIAHSSAAFSKQRTTYHYIWNKTFHVSPFMTMDHLYDWKFQLSKNYIQVEAKMRKLSTSSSDVDDRSSCAEEEMKSSADNSHDEGSKSNNINNNNDIINSNGKIETAQSNTTLFFTAGFQIQRPQSPSQNTSTYPIQLAKIISRFPIYCFLIQIWIHYEALKLLIKGVEFIPHPEGSETMASKAIAWVMSPVFRLMDLMDGGSSGGDGSGESIPSHGGGKKVKVI